jgi:hypothetical protein
MFCYRETTGGEEVTTTTHFPLCEKEGGAKFFALGGKLLSLTGGLPAKEKFKKVVSG